jgi:tetratricopeptide (TPR) repeat protein
MADPSLFKFTLAVDDFDLSLLPEQARQRGTPAFRDAVKEYLSGEFNRFGGWSSVEIDQRLIEVSWTPDRKPPDPLEQIVEKLNRGEYAGAITLLRLFLSDRPNDVNLLYNLGMALSDMGQLDDAVDQLRQAVSLAKDFVNARIALGVALQRQGKNAEAVAALNDAVAREPENPLAHRNLGACLAKAGKTKEAEAHFREATSRDSNDQQAMYGLAECLSLQGRHIEAHDAYKKAIAINEYGKTAELAREALRKMAEVVFKDRAVGGLRPDAVMYCLDAMEKFAKMPEEEVKRIASEIALKGRTGLDTNDPAQKYQLKSLPGDFSGLNLVCLMYVGFKSFAPEMDLGFDLSKEYAAAQELKAEKQTH